MTSRIRYANRNAERPELNPKQIRVLEKFIQRYLPNSGQRRIFGMNNLVTIHTAVDGLFLKELNYGIRERDLIDTFERMGYIFRTTLEKWSEIKTPSTDGFYEEVHEEILEARKTKHLTEHNIHISVFADDVRDIIHALQRLPFETGKDETIEYRIRKKSELSHFLKNL